MKKYRDCAFASLLILIYSLLAGGSSDESFNITLIVIAAALVIFLIVMVVTVNVKTKEETEKNLAIAEDIIGKYTDKYPYDKTHFILVDKPTHRMCLNERVIDYTKIRELKTTAKAPSTKVTYHDEVETKKSTGSVAGRALVGAAIAGPVGALLGGVTTKSKTVTKKVADYTPVNGHYTLTVVDDKGVDRAYFSFSEEKPFNEVYGILKVYLDENLKPIREAEEKRLLEEKKQIEEFDVSKVVLGALLSDITVVTRDAEVTNNVGDIQTYSLGDNGIKAFSQLLGFTPEIIELDIKDDIVKGITIDTRKVTAGSFKLLLFQMDALRKVATNIYGEPDILESNIDYTLISEDKPNLLCYSWPSDTDLVGLTLCYEDGKYLAELAIS